MSYSVRDDHYIILGNQLERIVSIDSEMESPVKAMTTSAEEPANAAATEMTPIATAMTADQTT